MYRALVMTWEHCLIWALPARDPNDTLGVLLQNIGRLSAMFAQFVSDTGATNVNDTVRPLLKFHICRIHVYHDQHG